jgi:uncharacterized protein YijF (DUF1287 family)
MKTILLNLLLLVCTFNLANGQTNFYDKLSDAALGLTKQKVVYDPAYFTISYPNGDVPADKGVCTDVVIRAYRKVGIVLKFDFS